MSTEKKILVFLFVFVVSIESIVNGFTVPGKISALKGKSFLVKKQKSRSGQEKHTISNIRKPSFGESMLSTSLSSLKAEKNSPGSQTKKGWFRKCTLARPHERAIFIFYALVGATAIYWRSIGYITQVNLETGLALVWLGMILGVSFLEAWVKFKAPFLRKYVAVDVGRHVFAALNAAELALAGSLWTARLFAIRQTASTLPVVITLSLLVQALWIGPLLFLRAKAKTVKGFEDEVPSNALTLEEKEELDVLTQEVKDVSLPSPKFHFVYTLLELVKVVCLNWFVFSWWKLQQLAL